MKESGKERLKCVAYESTRVPTFKLRGSTGLEGSKGSKGSKGVVRRIVIWKRRGVLNIRYSWKIRNL